jgi:hypothetical protein
MGRKNCHVPSTRLQTDGNPGPSTCPPRPYAPLTQVPSEDHRPPRPLTSEERRSLYEITLLRPNIGRVHEPDTDLHIRTAYYVLIVGETINATGRLAGVSPERVRQRVRLGVYAALRQMGDSVREELRNANLWRLRRHALELKPALEKAFLALPSVGTAIETHPPDTVSPADGAVLSVQTAAAPYPADHAGLRSWSSDSLRGTARGRVEQAS